MLGDAIQQQTIVDKMMHLRRGGLVSDDDFDGVFSASVQERSRLHWTPVRVARRAAQLLVCGPKTRVLDVGSGAGKFCVIGALTTEGKFTGIEQRRHLIEESRQVVQALRVPRVEFIHGNMVDLDWSAFNAFYFFNPFYENVSSWTPIDRTVPTSIELCQTYVQTVRDKLSAMPIGTRAVTYHGFGGKFPDGYHLTATERIGSNCLNVWVKTRNSGTNPQHDPSTFDVDTWPRR